jgi:hypothetical protein
MTLGKLIEAVEAGTATGGPDAMIVPFEMGELIQIVTGDDDELWSDFVEAHDGFLDAAKRLHDALLPEWTAVEIRSRGARTRWVVDLSRIVDEGEVFATGHNKDAARAYLIAIIRALEQEGRDGSA